MKLKKKIEFVCDFCNTTPKFINGSIRKIDKTNLSYIEPHRIIINDITFLAFNYSNEIFIEDLKQLEPFGAGNEEPIFRLRNVQILNVTRMGADRNHLRLDLRDNSGKQLKCIAFYAPEAWLNLDVSDRIEPLVQLIENEWNGIKSVEARLLDLDFSNH